MTAPVHDLDDPRRAAIVRQARLHFINEGYSGTRMEPIARESGVSTATLYAFFDSKAALFEAVINTHRRTSPAICRPCLSSPARRASG